MESKERLRAEENVCMMFNRFLSLCTAEQEEHKTLILNMKQAFLEIAPVDAVEVVHGRWEDEHGGKYANPRYRCSACKERALYKFELDLLFNWKEVQALTPICPHCGAILDGGAENGKM